MIAICALDSIARGWMDEWTACLRDLLEMESRTKLSMRFQKLMASQLAVDNRVNSSCSKTQSQLLQNVLRKLETTISQQLLLTLFQGLNA